MIPFMILETHHQYNALLHYLWPFTGRIHHFLWTYRQLALLKLGMNFFFSVPSFSPE